jgi:1-deoxy-D-xylulose-5-phosphate reductoisomerase
MENIMIKNISILGSTGSIGVQTLDIARRMNINITALAAGSNTELLYEQIKEFEPDIAAVYNPGKALELSKRTSGFKTEILSGQEGVNAVAAHNNSEMVIAAIVGMAGLLPTWEAIKAGKRIGLANKETLVTAGDIIMEEVRKKNITMIPVDSEHSAVFQCLEGNSSDYIKRIILTASGGPFRGKTKEEIKEVTLAEALNHPNWDMGSKITIDSASLMNKGLEVIEAHHLFSVNADRIDVVVHPESIIHSMVEYVDGSILAQLGLPDMRTPIQYAITYPERSDKFCESMDFLKMGSLNFNKPDSDTFKCLKLAYNALESGGSMPVVLNSANEIAVDCFLKEKIDFYRIADIIEHVMIEHETINNPAMEDILEIDRETRIYAAETAERYRK